MTQLPATVRQALEGLLSGRSIRDLAARSVAISQHYRNRSDSSGVVKADDDALAYAAARMPATFAAMVHALGALGEAAVDVQPVSLLDAGCGPGTAAIAALDAFPGIETLALVDRSTVFLDLARNIVGPAAQSRSVTFSSIDITSGRVATAADLVTAGYLFAELRDDAVIGLARALWASAQQALVITEPGTPDGFRRIRAIREDLIGQGAHVAAPCTHHGACPMTEGAWCRVPIRVQRSRDHRVLKGGQLGYEDEPVAYLALTRAPPTRRPGARVVAEPVSTKAGLTLRTCGAEGLADFAIAARDRENFRKYKRLRWGAAI